MLVSFFDDIVSAAVNILAAALLAAAPSVEDGGDTIAKLIFLAVVVVADGFLKNMAPAS